MNHFLDIWKTSLCKNCRDYFLGELFGEIGALFSLTFGHTDVTEPLV